MFPEFASRFNFERPNHPGTVTFVGDSGENHTEPADSIPDWLKFAPGPDGSAIPVVRIVRLLSDRGYSIRSYGVEGQLLWVGLTIPTGPPVTPASHEPSMARPARYSRPVDHAPSSKSSTGWF